MPTCQKCGARADPEDEFCPECGARMGALPARGVIAVQPKKHRFLKAILIIIVIILVLRACASFSSPSQVYRPIQEVSAPAEGERLVTIETPPPRVNPIPGPEPIPATAATGCSSGGETMVVDFKSPGVSTTNLYSGIVPVSVTGTGQSMAIAYNDAFYVYTSRDDGSPITPQIMDFYMLFIDNQPASRLAAAPAYNPEHSYQFTIDAGSIPRTISFKIGDDILPDNSGFFIIDVC